MRRQDFLGPLFNGGPDERKQMGIYALRAVGKTVRECSRSCRSLFSLTHGALGILLSPVRGLVELVTFLPYTVWDLLSTAGAFNRLPSLPSPTRSIWFRSLAGGQAYKAYTSTVWGARIVWDAPVFAYRYLL